MTQTGGDIRECLARLPENRSRWTHALREIVEADPAARLPEAVEILGESGLPGESARTLLGVLIASGQLLAALQGVYDVSLPRFRTHLLTAHALEPRLHLRLSQRLTDVLRLSSAERPNELLCLVDAVQQLCGLVGLTSAVGAMRQSADPRLRAKAALVEGMQHNGRNLLDRFLSEPDPRVRFHIVEGLWPIDEPAARVIFEEARKDQHHRVRAAGLMGLYCLSQQESLSGLQALAESPFALGRAAACSAIETIRDPRLDRILAKLHKEFGASTHRVNGCFPGASVGSRRVSVWALRAARGENGEVQLVTALRPLGSDTLTPPMRPIDFRAWVNGEPVLDYLVTRIQLTSPLALGIVLPYSARGAEERAGGIRDSIEELRALPPGEWRSLAFFRSGLFLRPADVPAPAPTLEEEDPPVSATPWQPAFISEGFRLAAEIRDAARLNIMAEEPGEPALAMLQRLKTLKCRGHVGVVLCNAMSGAPKPHVVDAIRQSCADSGSRLHLLKIGDTAAETLRPWAALCRAVNGYELTVGSEDELPEVFHRWVLSLRETYRIEFTASANARQIRLEVVHPAGRGATSIEIDDEPAGAGGVAPTSLSAGR